MHAGHEVPVLAEHVERRLPHPRHHPHRGRDIGRVGELDADVGDRRAERAHRERHDIHRAPAHRPGEQLAEHLAHLSGLAPVVGRTRVGLLLGADERPVLHPRDVGRIRQRQVGVGVLGLRQALERSRVDEYLCQLVELLV
jgi:hypothetical protein